ncbi:UDP-3-O-(3-hydroxymyristoyl)glucosamine N-acyltransferase [Candidatus Venteria ishoeyi]|uniref:UDP-3-O-acylglucosamine N-acyltransferase n=1 Tax=Candidatus Venteria ishoeyi TaxID=1899563 RepID=A0A1H6F9W5_9GAMM|nr:UDP-3-O-(3-hydroxymyristoyl)glucosamine N-acyltransferase [Candidatus Venteria ishoeyi]MDM8547989.1 UDP-3-O-(3-hydroxymyristoyl)glucosamine N-acyltransferase [Candidatus Venteria ishoeyi]SEH05946.1 UDP-3-O-acylglucosamine N-acyltransferase [Candidatus Venteria ishoeyi]
MGSSSITLQSLADHIGAKLALLEPQQADAGISNVATLMAANAGSVSFFSNRLYRKALQETRASAVIISSQDAAFCPVSRLVVDNPYVAYAHAARLLNIPEPLQAGVHPSAWVSPEAWLHPSVEVGPNAVVEAGVKLLANVRIGPGCVIEKGCEIGEDSYLHANVTICTDSQIGKKVIIHAGAVIGADGFGLARDHTGWVKVPQLGIVRVGNEVEIGANTTIDRGALGDTVLHDQVKLDNLVHIAHNVQIGEQTAIAAQSGIAGSTKIGARCLFGGKTGVVGHIEITDDVHVTGGSNILRAIVEPGVYSSGTPLEKNQSWRKNYLRFQQLDKMAKQLKKLQAFLETRKRD